MHCTLSPLQFEPFYKPWITKDIKALLHWSAQHMCRCWWDPRNRRRPPPRGEQWPDVAYSSWHLSEGWQTTFEGDTCSSPRGTTGWTVAISPSACIMVSAVTAAPHRSLCNVWSKSVHLGSDKWSAGCVSQAQSPGTPSIGEGGAGLLPDAWTVACYIRRLQPGRQNTETFCVSGPSRH